MKNLLLLFLPLLLSNQLTVLASTQADTKPLSTALSSDYVKDLLYDQGYFHDLDVSKSNIFTTYYILSRSLIIFAALALGILLFVFNKPTIPKSNLIIQIGIIIAFITGCILLYCLLLWCSINIFLHWLPDLKFQAIKHLLTIKYPQ